jgi:DNA-directed RNA polymerase beta' subunit
VRRYRLGYIELAVPVVHIWYLKGRPSYFSLLFDLKQRSAEAIAYCTGQILNGFSTKFEQKILLQRKEYHERFLKWKRFQKERPRNWRVNLPFKLVIATSISRVLDDDFWVKRQYPFVIECFHKDWNRRDFHKHKPFYTFPFVKDSFIAPLECGAFQGVLENFLGVRELRHSLTLKGENAFIPIKKYQRGFPNSKLSDMRFFNLPNWFLRGGKAFLHLCTKIDCRRFEKALCTRLNWIQSEIEEIEYTPNLNFEEDKVLFRRYQDLLRQLAKLSRRIKFVQTFWKSDSRPEWMLISILPVLPPDLRPIIKLKGDQLAVSDLNPLYQRVFNRNKALKKIQPSDPSARSLVGSVDLFAFNERLLQEAVDDLLENGKEDGSQRYSSSAPERPLKSLSDLLKGKKGRFRLNLLGKRVDYSGRSVIIVGPSLKLHECGLPKEIALELFQTLLIRKLLSRKFVKTIMEAKKLIRNEHPLIWPILNEIMLHWPVLLNRAPTLHRLGVQAFLPKLVRGKAILLHPLVCTAFNADFDGDQMGVHLPLSYEAKSEAWSLMLSTQNLLSPATSEPILVPSQDMVLGCYYLTTINANRKQANVNYFTSLDDVLKTSFNQNLHPHTWIWLKWPDILDSDQKNLEILEIRLNSVGEKIYIRKACYQIYTASGKLKSQYIRTTVGRVVFNSLLYKTFYDSKLKYYEYESPPKTNPYWWKTNTTIYFL